MSEPTPTEPAPILPTLSPTKGRLPIARAWNRFVRDPASARNAIIVLIGANVFTVLVGGVAIWLLDRREFERLTDAFWYILQTVTTVGYGDVTPKDTIGRLVGAAVMLVGIAILSIITAIITSAFVEARQADRHAQQAAAEAAHRARLEARLDELVDRLERIEDQGRGDDAAVRSPTPEA